MISKIYRHTFFDFYICDILDIISIYDLIVIYIAVFLEQNVLIFSSNIETLSLIMYIITQLTYPFNDIKYNQCTKIINKDKIKIYKNNSKLLGINSNFSQNLIDDCNNGLVVDIDDTEQKFKQFNVFMKNINETVTSIKTFGKSSNDYITNIICTAIKNTLKYFPQNTPTPSDKEKFLDNDKDSIEDNKKLQNIFYKLSLDLFSLATDNYILQSNTDDISKLFPMFNITIRKISIAYSSECKVFDKNVFQFKDIFIYTEKYKTFFIDFVINNKYIDKDKFNLHVFACFLNLNILTKSYKRIDYFDIISTISSQSSPNNKIYTNFSFDYFKSYYERHIKKYMDDSSIKTDLIQFNKNILIEYIYHMNNIPKQDLNEIFPTKFFLYHPINYNDISTLIFHNVLSQRNKIKDILLVSYVIVSCMLYETNSFEEQISYIQHIGYLNYRDIIHFFLWVFLMIIRYKNNKDIQREISFCNEMISYLKKNNILPLHETLELIRQVNVIESKFNKIIKCTDNSSRITNKKRMPFSIVLFEVKEKEIRLIKDAIVSSLRKGYEESEEGNILINYKNTKRTVVFYILINKHTKFIMKELNSPMKMLVESFSLMKEFSNMLTISKLNTDRLLDLLCSIVFYFNFIDIYKDLKIDFIFK